MLFQKVFLNFSLKNTRFCPIKQHQQKIAILSSQENSSMLLGHKLYLIVIYQSSKLKRLISDFQAILKNFHQEIASETQLLQSY